jgi:hypothetical protein
MALYQNYKISGCHFLQASHNSAHHDSGQNTLWLWFHNISPLAFSADVEPILERCFQFYKTCPKHMWLEFANWGLHKSHYWDGAFSASLLLPCHLHSNSKILNSHMFIDDSMFGIEMQWLPNLHILLQFGTMLLLAQFGCVRCNEGLITMLSYCLALNLKILQWEEQIQTFVN